MVCSINWSISPPLTSLMLIGAFEASHSHHLAAVWTDPSSFWHFLANRWKVLHETEQSDSEGISLFVLRVTDLRIILYHISADSLHIFQMSADFISMNHEESPTSFFIAITSLHFIPALLITLISLGKKAKKQLVLWPQNRWLYL